MTKTIEEFATQITENPTVRDNFLEEFVDEVIDSMDPNGYYPCLCTNSPSGFV